MIGVERRLERAADAHRAGRGVPARRAGRARQPARSRPRPAARSSRTTSSTMATFHVDQDRHAERPAAHRRRPGAAARRRQGRARGGGDRPEGDRPRVPRRLHDRVRGRTARCVAATPWAELERQSGVAEATIRELARGLLAVASARSSPGASASPSRSTASTRSARSSTCCCCAATSAARAPARRPIRGHTNVQGNRTCGIDHRPSEEFLDRLAEVCGIDAAARARPRHGRARSRRCTRGEVKVFVGMGGNFVLAAPDTALHLRGAAQLRADGAGQHEAQPQPPRPRPRRADPALPRPHREGHPARRARRAITVEDSMSMVHLSHGMKEPASPHLRSEPAIIAGMALATPAGVEDAVAGLRRRLRPHPRHDGRGARRLRGLQPPRAPAARLPASSSPPASAVFLTAIRAAPSSPPRRCPTSSRRPAA